MKSIIVNGITINHGDFVEGSIEGTPVKGKIHTGGDASGVWCFFLQNTFSGSVPTDKNMMGYSRSWTFHQTNLEGVEITKNLTSGQTATSGYPGKQETDTRPYLDAPGVGKLYHGDYIKVKIDAYKPKILFKCKLVIHNGVYYLNNDKIGSTAVYGFPKFKYPYLYNFTKQLGGSGFTNTVTIKELIERADVVEPAKPGVFYADDYGQKPSSQKPQKVETQSHSRQYPFTQGESYVKTGNLVVDTHNQYTKAVDKAVSDKTSTHITIPRRRLLKLNQNG